MKAGITAAADAAAEASAEIARLLRNEYEKRLRNSAEAFVVASEAGASDLLIATTCKALLEEEGFTAEEAKELYTSPTSVGFHRRAGLILRMPGPLPEGASVRALQALIKKTPAKTVDAVIQDSRTQWDAYQRLAELCAKPSREK